MLLLLPVAGLCLVSLLRDRSFDRTQLWNAAAAREGLPRVLLLFALTAPILAAGVLLFLPSAFLGLARRAPFLWGAIMLLYPLLSVYPQELIYRAFLFQRYRPLLGGDAALTGWSAAAFGFVHILYGSFVPVLLSLAGGYLFATSYRRSRSLLLAATARPLRRPDLHPRPRAVLLPATDTIGGGHMVAADRPETSRRLNRRVHRLST